MKKNVVKKSERFGTFLAFLTAFISGFAIFANKFFIIGIDPVIFTALRAIMIGLIFLGLSFLFNSWEVKKKPKNRWVYLLLIGITGGGIAFLLFFTGLKLTTGGRAAFLHKTLPIYVTILAVLFLKEKVTKKQLIALFVMLVGLVTLVASQISPSSLWLNPSVGDALVLLATVLWGVENVIAKHAMRKGESSIVVSFSRMFFGAVFLFGVALFTNKIHVIATISYMQWFYIILSTLILFCYVYTYYLSLKHINVSKAATILVVAPVITLVLGILFLGEPAPFMQLVGSALILIGAYFIAGLKSEVSQI